MSSQKGDGTSRPADLSKGRQAGLSLWARTGPARVLQAVATTAGVLVATACGQASTPAQTTSTVPPVPSASSSAPAPSTQAATASSAVAPAAASAPNPNAPEVNPAGDIPDNQVFVPFNPPATTFEVSVPQGWARSSDSKATTFTDNFNSVRIEGRPLSGAPSVESVRAEDVPALQSSVPGFALGDVRVVKRSSGPAVLLTYTATSPPSAVTGKSVTEAVERYAFWRGGEEVVLTLSGPQGADNVDPWRKITDSLRWL
jgi:hypothetical protein